jgi:hypothetical protein
MLKEEEKLRRNPKNVMIRKTDLILNQCDNSQKLRNTRNNFNTLKCKWRSNGIPCWKIVSLLKKNQNSQEGKELYV